MAGVQVPASLGRLRCVRPTWPTAATGDENRYFHPSAVIYRRAESGNGLPFGGRHGQVRTIYGTPLCAGPNLITLGSG